MKACLPAVCMVITGVFVLMVSDIMVGSCTWDVEVGLRSGSPRLGLVFTAGSLASPLFTFTKEGPSAGNGFQL